MPNATLRALTLVAAIALRSGLVAETIPFPPVTAPPPRAAAFPDLSKGRPPAVLDARVGVNIRLGDDPSVLPASQRGQAEPHIVRSTANPDLLLAAFQEGRYFDGGAVDCGYAISRDGGLTWTRTMIPNLSFASGGRFNRATDPVAGIGPQGDLYLQTLGSTAGAFDRAAVVVSRSTDGGATWSTPATVFEQTNALISPDKNWLAVNDYPGTPNFGRLVSTWTNFVYNAAGTALGTPIVISLSDDRGATWSPSVDLNPLGSSSQGSQPLFLPDGSLVIVYIQFTDVNNVNRFRIDCKRSVDGGRTFPATVTSVVPAVEGWDDPDLRDGVFLPMAAVARQTGAIFVTYTAVINGSPRVLVVKSTNSGATWSAPVIASDQPTGVSVVNPAIAVTPDGRTVSTVFMDKRNAPDGHSFIDIYAANSFDGGLTWQPNVRLTEMSSDIRLGPPTSRGVMLGDYMGIAPSLAPDQPCVAIWCDTRTGDSDPFTVRFMPTQTPDYAAWSTVRGGRVGLSHLDDTDGDGVPNYLEYLSGTDPLKADSGQDLVVRQLSPSSIEVAWTVRTNVEKAFASEGIAAVTASRFAAGGFSTAGIVTTALSTEQLPANSPGAGLEWNGARITIPSGEAEVLTRAYRFSAGLPVKASESIASTNTNARLVNHSTRGSTAPGNPLIVGFVIDGNKSILVRAAGPTLTALGVSSAIANPRLALDAPASDLSRTNDDWANGGATAADFARLGAFPFTNNSLDSALLLPLGIQAYTATVTNAANSRGIALVEAYDADAIPGTPGNARFVNLSTRSETGAGANSLIAGFAISGTQPRTILIRAAGPSLARFGVSDALADPLLTLFRGSTLLATNDDWEISRSGAAIAATAQRVGAFPLNSASLDAALLVTLAPGSYSVVVAGADGGSGIALVEVYDAD